MTTLTIVLLAAAGVATIVGLVVAVLVIEARAIERAGDALGDGDAFHLTPREWDQIQAAHDRDRRPGATSPAPGRFDGPEPRPYRRLNGDTTHPEH